MPFTISDTYNPLHMSACNEYNREHNKELSFCLDIARASDITSAIKSIWKGRKQFLEIDNNLKEMLVVLSECFSDLNANYLHLKRMGNVSEAKTNIYKEVRDVVCFLSRDNRIILDPALIEQKLEKQMSAAQKHRQSQRALMSRGALIFQYLEALSDPNFDRDVGFTSKQCSIDVGRKSYDIGISQIQASKPHQEDEALASSFSIIDIDGRKRDMLLVGVFDGHSGGTASKYIKKHLKGELEDLLKKEVDKALRTERADLSSESALTKVVIWNILKTIGIKLSERFKQTLEKSGTTANFSLLIDGEDLWTVNIGDSRSLIVCGGRVSQLSEDMVFKFDFPQDLTEEEFSNIEQAAGQGKDPYINSYERGLWKRGGYCKRTRGNGKLAPARSIGDIKMGNSLSARSKVTHISLSKNFPIGESAYLVHATDGLWDSATTMQVAYSVDQHRSLGSYEISRNLTYSGYKASDFDNITTVVTRINRDEISR